jgi:hypothetical protein
MHTVSTGGGRHPLSQSAASAIESLALLGLGVDRPDLNRFRPVSPAELASVLPDAAAAATTLEILGIGALVDETLDAARIDQVLHFAEQCAVSDHWLDDLSQSTELDLSGVIADMSDRNLLSVTHGQLDLAHVGDINTWILPYEGERRDDALNTRYRDLAVLPVGSFGREFWAFYDRHRFNFPGQPGAANEMFTTPHDSTHLLAGYDTTPQGELLVSTFTARMHPFYPMEGHILPVIYSWHLGIEFNKLAGSYRGALDPAKFWVAWDRGMRTEGDAFGEEFDFWAHVEMPLSRLQDEFAVPPLDPRYAAYSDAVAGVHYNPVA